MITGIPGETAEDLAESEALIARLRPHDVQISPLAVYPGTRLHSELLVGGEIEPNFFRSRNDTEIWARPNKKDPRKGYDGFTAKALTRLRRASISAVARARYTARDFDEHRKLLGWCATTNIIRGEAAEEIGDLDEAVRQYSEMTQKEPQNPWGWLKRGRVRLEQGFPSESRADYREALAIMPNNAEAAVGAESSGRSTMLKSHLQNL
jgi:tetratricopeptide (TPR) repeat protein